MSFWDWLQGKTDAPDVVTSTPVTDSRVVSALPVVAPHADVSVWASALYTAMQKADITTPDRIAAFLGQISVESAGLTTLTENLNYGALRLTQVWPSHFPTLEIAQAYAGQPEKIANRAYANRMGNGDEASGDGWRYRGGGLIDLTGKSNYQAFAAKTSMSVEAAADWVRTPEGAAASACSFWTDHELNELADAWNITSLSARINGGALGLGQRIALCNAARKAIGS